MSVCRLGLRSTRSFALYRTYATESALASKAKGAPPSAKATRKATAVSSAAPKRTSAKVEDRATGHPGATAAAAEVKTLPRKTPVAAAAATPAQAPQQSVEEKNLTELEALQYFAQVMRDADPYGQPVPQSLDVVLTRPAPLTSIPKLGLTGWWQTATTNLLNNCKNAMSLLYLASDDAIPGTYLGNPKWWQAIGWIPKAFGAVKSQKADGWLAPLRAAALAGYVDLNTTIARRDVKRTRLLTTSDYQAEMLRRIKKQPANLQFRWNFEKEVTPTQILSLRATQYYMGKEDPKFGNRYMVHALVKFDTEQSLEIYDAKGKPLHEVPAGATKRANGSVPAVPKRVTEYLIIEKRMWYDTPWVFREQRWEASK